MSDFDLWLQANDEFLAPALRALRLRLEQMAGPAATPPPQQAAPAAPADAPAPLAATPARPRSLLDRLFQRPARPSGLATDTAAATVTAPAQAFAPSRNAEPDPEPGPGPEPDRSADPHYTPALMLLSQRLGLTDFERDTLLLCAAMELDTRIATLCARAQGETGRPYPTFALALALFDNPAWDVLSPERPLRYWRLIEIHQPGVQPLVTSAIKIDERIVNYLKGLNYLDDRLVPFMTPVASSSEALPPSQARMADAIVARLEGAAQAPPLVQLAGADGASKLAVLGQAAAQLGLTVYRLAADHVPLALADQDTLSRLWQRECILLPIALYVDAGALDHGGAQAAALLRILGRGTGVTFLDTREPWPDAGAHAGSALFDIAKPNQEEQRAVWLELLGQDQVGLAARLAGQFNFNRSAIQAVAGPALERAGAGQAESECERELWQACLQHARPALNQLAQVLEVKAGWDDLALPAADKRLLRQIADQVARRMTVYDDWGFRARMNRGLGISVLFSGESGTGKTMAAEVIANELQLLLYRIDLSAVVSKYIGETEKNLRKLFDAAEDGGAILFFDEADALFGKRSAVKDSHDRYANIEINYLLQRIESYRGLAILATNMKGALDNAFLRRLRFIINFPVPAAPQRKAIWQKVFPPETHTEGLDYDRLARLNLTGGLIHNVALNAAFLAAQNGTTVTLPLVLTAARAEFRKLDRPINEGDFRWLETVGTSV